MVKNVKKSKNKWALILAFVLPALLFYGLFNLVGIARTFYYSFMDWRGISENKEFIGLLNYIAVAKDGIDRKSTRLNSSH